MSLELQRAFGLRREESLKVKPWQADHGDRLVLQGSWTKGGRPREIPLGTLAQRDVLDRAKALVKFRSASLIPPHKTYEQQLHSYESQCFRAGLHKMHGLRHAYAQDRFPELAGFACPAAGGPTREQLTPEQREADYDARVVISAELGHGREAITAALYALSIDPGHPHSIFFSLKKARDNARTVREALTIEVFVALNETYKELEAYNRRQMADPTTFRSALAATQRGILSTAGAVEQTLARDPGWLFLKLGESMERVFRTAVVLRVKLPTLMAQEPKVDLPLFYTRWRALLRGLSSLENYRKVHGARMEPADALQFLLFDPHTPRSVRYGTTSVKEILERISAANHLSLPARIMGKLAADLAYQGQDVLHDGQALPFLDQVLGELTRCHDTLSTTYFGT
jgi:uncharacterized alpha-E superfamily protein